MKSNLVSYAALVISVIALLVALTPTQKEFRQSSGQDASTASLPSVDERELSAAAYEEFATRLEAGLWDKWRQPLKAALADGKVTYGELNGLNDTPPLAEAKSRFARSLELNQN